MPDTATTPTPNWKNFVRSFHCTYAEALCATAQVFGNGEVAFAPGLARVVFGAGQAPANSAASPDANFNSGSIPSDKGKPRKGTHKRPLLLVSNGIPPQPSTMVFKDGNALWQWAMDMLQAWREFASTHWKHALVVPMPWGVIQPDVLSPSDRKSPTEKHNAGAPPLAYVPTHLFVMLTMTLAGYYIRDLLTVGCRDLKVPVPSARQNVALPDETGETSDGCVWNHHYHPYWQNTTLHPMQGTVIIAQRHDTIARGWKSAPLTLRFLRERGISDEDIVGAVVQQFLQGVYQHPESNGGLPTVGLPYASTAHEEAIIKRLVAVTPLHQFDLDPTYSTGRFWRGVTPPNMKMDVVPQAEGVRKASVTHLPLSDASVSSVMFDPPFVIGQPNKGGKIGPRFGYYHKMDDLWRFYQAAMLEIHRVLRPDGILAYKAQDTHAWGTQYWSSLEIFVEAMLAGFSFDWMALVTRRQMLWSPNMKNQKHARKAHSYFFLFRKIGDVTPLGQLLLEDNAPIAMFLPGEGQAESTDLRQWVTDDNEK